MADPRIVIRNGREFHFDADVPDEEAYAKIDAWLKANTPKIPGNLGPRVAPRTLPPAPDASPIDRLRAIGQVFGGATDEAVAGIRSLGGDDYDAALRDERAGVSRAEHQYPGQTLLGQIGVGVGTGLAANRAIAAASPRVRAVMGLSEFVRKNPKKAMAVSGGLGAGAAGFGSAEDGLIPRLEAGAWGTGVGATLGPIVGYAPEAVGAIKNRLFPGLKGADEYAAGRMARVLEQNGMTPDRMDARLTRDRSYGAESMPLNVAPGLLDEAESLVTRGGRAGANVTAALASQGAGQRGRIREGIEWTLSPNNFYDTQGELRKDLRDAAKTAYEKAYLVKDIVDPALDELVRHPFGQKAYAHAATMAGNELPSRVIPTLERVKDGHPGTYDTETLHRMRKAVDDILYGAGTVSEEFKNPLTGRLTEQGKQLSEYRRALSERIGALNPEFRAANDLYSDKAAVVSALQRGRDTALSPQTMTRRELQEHLKGLSPAEVEAYRSGAAEAIYAKYLDTMAKNKTGDFADFINKPGVNERLMPLFESHKDWLLFKGIMTRQSQLKKDAARITQGSPSARRIVQQASADSLDTTVDVAGSLAHAAHGSPAGMFAFMRGVMRMIPNTTAKQRDALSRMLTAGTPAERDEVMRKIRDEVARQANVNEAALLQRPATAAIAGGTIETTRNKPGTEE